MERENKQQISYYAVIPANVRYDKNVCPNAKLLYGEITALCNQRGYCWANNYYFAELYNVSKTSISKWISQLVNNGYVVSAIQYKEGTKEILNRYLRIVAYPIEEKLNTPIEEKLKDNTTVFNNTKNSILSDKPDGVEKIIEHLNQRIGTEYKTTTSKTISLINARLKEGFTIDDFFTVIEKKAAEWVNDEKMERYLRPETLFSNKFESYLNQKETIRPDPSDDMVKKYGKLI